MTCDDKEAKVLAGTLDEMWGRLPSLRFRENYQGPWNVGAAPTFSWGSEEGLLALTFFYVIEAYLL